MYPKMCLVMVPIGVQKIESLSSSEKKWQAIENLVHILLEWTLVMAWKLCSKVRSQKHDRKVLDVYHGSKHEFKL